MYGEDGGGNGGCFLRECWRRVDVVVLVIYHHRGKIIRRYFIKMRSFESRLYMEGKNQLEIDDCDAIRFSSFFALIVML